VEKQFVEEVSLQTVTVTIYFFRHIIGVGCVMESVVEKLQRVGLTKYEAKACLALLNTHLSTVFNIAWLNDKVLGISTIEYGKCVKCLAGSFEGGWRYSQKW
jgi:hypothetical protein